jgi:hypothetical protein
MPRTTTTDTVRFARPTVDELQLRIEQLETDVFQTAQKLLGLGHLFSQYNGELQFSDEAAHGLGLMLDDMADALTASYENKKGGA